MGDTQVRSYTRNGRTVSGYRQSRPDGNPDEYGPGDRPSEDPAAQKKRHRFEARVQAEQLRERQRAEATYDTGQRRTPGERKARKQSHGKKARQHWRKAGRTAKKRGWTRAYHRTAATMFGVSAAGRWTARKLRGEWS